MENGKHLGIIYNFVDKGAKIVTIEHSYGLRHYVFEHWEAATPTMHKHKIIGRDITEIVSQSAHMENKNTDEQLIMSTMMRFNDMRRIILEIHKDTKFVMYAS